MTREVEARLKLSAVDRTQKAFDAVQRRLKAVERQTSAVNRASAAVARSTEGAVLGIGRVLAPAALAYGGARAVSDFAAFELQLERIGITAGATVEETKKARGELQSLAHDMGLPIEAATAGFDTLVSSGLSLEQAMAFLPSVLKTAQATGSATEDIANTALKSSSALQIQAGEMQSAFDIMVTGGKAGQFELKDMAAYIPGLANSFASLGYKGRDGLKELIAVLQTIREDTGSAEAAATQAQNIFGKMYAGDTANKFKNFGIDLRKEMKAAQDAGEGAVEAFVRLSKEAIDGDLSKLPLLFTDQEFRLGMQSLMTSADSYERFIDAVNSSSVEGTVDKDFKRISDSTQISIQKMTDSWDQFMKSVGGAAAPTATSVLDNLSSGINNAPKADAIRKARGDSALSRTMMYGSSEDAALIAEYDSYDKMGAEGSPEAIRLRAQRNAANPGRLDGEAVSKRGYAIPQFRDAPVAPNVPPALTSAQTAPLISARAAESQSMAAMRDQFGGLLAQGGSSFQKGVTGQDLLDEAGIDRLRQAMESGSQSVAAAGDTAGSSIQAGGDAAAASLSSTFQQGAALIGSTIKAALSTAVKVNVSTGPSALPRANAAPATTMPNAGVAGSD